MKSMSVIGQVEAVLVGKAVPYARGADSAIDKHGVTGPQQVSFVGLVDDEQGDKRIHGGVEKALHIYPREHYAAWQRELGEKPVFEKAGAFGENISASGVTEHTVCLHDKVRIGTTLLEVSQARLPCWKLNIRFDQPDMALKLQETLRTGWYFRVLEVGVIAQGDAIELVERPYPEWPLSRILEVIFSGSLDEAALRPLLSLPLVDSWRKVVERRLDNQQLEDWEPRLFGRQKMVK